MSYNKIVVIILGILTVVLGAISIYVGIRLQQDQAPEDTEATNNCCGTEGYPSCSADNPYYTFEQGYRDCLKGGCSACREESDGYCGDEKCGPGESDNPDDPNSYCPTDCGTDAPSCADVGEGCANNNDCCASGAVCANNTCQIPEDNVCGAEGTCTGYISFHCDTLTNGKCEENPVNGYDLEHVAGCGQIDQVCEGGDNNRQLCGDFTIFDSNCGVKGGGGTPSSSVSSTTSSSSSTTSSSSSTTSSSSSTSSSTSSSSSSSLPDTGIFDESYTPLVVGLMLIALGIIFNRFQNIAYVINTSTRSISNSSTRAVTSFSKKLFESIFIRPISRSKYEKKLEKDVDKKQKNKK